jgi:SAM-dependent methyltransferase
MTVKSPVTLSSNTSKIEEFEISRIVELYKNLGLDVRRFFDGIESVELYQCSDTGYRFYYPFSIFGDDQFYQDLYTGIPGYYYPNRWEYNFSLKFIPQKSKVLEIGSGSGLFLDLLRRKGCDGMGLELNSKAISDTRKKGFKVEAELIESFSKNHITEFDVVCTYQVLEHVTDVRSFILAAIKTLKIGGKLIISVPNSHPYFLKHDKYHTLNMPPHHSGLWNKDSLKAIGGVFDLELIDLQTEPLKEFKEWYLVQKNHFKQIRPFYAKIMSLIPRFAYKVALKLFRKKIQGSYLTVIYKKNG